MYAENADDSLNKTMVTMADLTTFSRRYEVSGLVAASPGSVFDFLDSPSRLTDHMSKPTWTMGGGKMSLELDAGQGRRVGSTMNLWGSAFGLPLSLREVVIERDPPHRKVWQTVGEPRLWVIADHRLGFEISERSNGCRARVFIEYALPSRGAGRWLGRFFGSSYAKWCTRRMLGDARAHFSRHTAELEAAR